jgi:hypothetical protein
VAIRLVGFADKSPQVQQSKVEIPIWSFPAGQIVQIRSHLHSADPGLSADSCHNPLSVCVQQDSSSTEGEAEHSACNVVTDTRKGPQLI